MYHTNILFSERLLEWYQSNKRDLPWRDTADPYKIWVSEVMLQQTQVETVIPYYNRWIKRFPNIMELAKVEPEVALKQWEGLGYYSRCRNLHNAAQIIQTRFSGQIPTTYTDFITLPGAGKYTTAAVLSIAFNQPVPSVDGNLNRVISRVLGIKNLTPKNKKRIHSFLLKSISPNYPGDFNQALMDLGSGICNPKKVHCTACPLKKMCKANASGQPLNYPNPIKRPLVPHRILVGGIVWCKNKFFITRRRDNQMLGGLWEIPSVEIKKEASLTERLTAEIKEQLNFDVAIRSHAGRIHHAYTHFKITQDFFHCLLKNDSPHTINPDQRWIFPGDIIQYPFPKSNHKLFHQLNEKGWHV